MIESIFQFFEKLFTEFSLKRIAFVLGFIIVIIFIAWMFESYTGSYKLNRIERSVEILKELSLLSNDETIKKDKELTQIYNNLENELYTFLRNNELRFYISSDIWKIITSSLPWLILAIFFLPDLLKGKEGSDNTIIGLVVFAIPFIVVGYFIPTFQKRWINYFLYPWGSFLLLVVVVLIWKRIKRNGT